MNRRDVAFVFAVGLAALAVVVGVVLALWSPPKPETAAPGVAGTVGLLLGAVALVATALRARGDPGPDAEPPPWTESGRIVDRPPEETPDDVTVSGTDAAEVFADAAAAARSAGDVEAGVERVRAPLRETLGRALVAGGRDPGAVERALATGAWTDDRLAAAVLDESVDPPPRTFRERLRDWLYPERALRERTRRAVAAVDEAADEALPAVVGEEAPRTVPVVAPTLEDLQRTADGRLQRAEAVGDGGRRWWTPDRGVTGASAPGPPTGREGGEPTAGSGDGDPGGPRHGGGVARPVDATDGATAGDEPGDGETVSDGTGADGETVGSETNADGGGDDSASTDERGEADWGDVAGGDR